ncbi:MAG: hypothetical protein EBY22_10600 [Gammaproteobacteria bacterium]|nr:hypothetical protein [Gammaproteobacteria bacterium]
MREQETEHMSAGKFAWFAARDARMKSAINASRFTDSQKLKAERVKLALELVYYADDISITNCKKWIRVKVHKGTVKDRKTLAMLEQDWTAKGITKCLTNQGIIYHVV